MAVQSARFSVKESPSSVNKGQGWTVATARAWLQRNGFRSPAPAHTANQLRFRQFPPDQCRRGSYQTLTQNLPKGVELVDCKKS